MAAPADRSHKNGSNSTPDSELEALRQEHNNLVTSFRALLTKVDTANVAGIGNNNFSTIADAAVATAPKLVQTI